MNSYFDAQGGLKKLFVGTVGALICNVLSAVPILGMVAAAGSLLFTALAIYGLFQAGKDIPGCKSAFLLYVIEFVVQLMASAFTFMSIGNLISSICVIVQAILDMVIIYLVCTSVSNVMNAKGRGDIANFGRNVWILSVIAYVLIFALMVPYLLVTQPTAVSAKTTYRGAYSNLVDAQSRKEVKTAMLDAGLSKKNVNAWLSDVKDYNKTIKNTGLVKKGFKKLSTKNPQYDENKIMELWNAKYPDFIGYNCRITAFDLLKDKISVKADAKANASNLFMDQDALKHAPAKKFTKKQKHAFETLYSTLNTAYTTDVDTHVRKQKKAWKQNEVTISGTKASLITVVFHSSFGEDENELFIGHAGVLVPTKDKKLLFVEKLSFSLPYQVLKFDNRKQLKDYLMGMYDTSWGQEEAKPFIMENTKSFL